MNLKDILELIDKVADRGIGAVEVEQAGTRRRIEGKSAPPAPVLASTPTCMAWTSGLQDPLVHDASSSSHTTNAPPFSSLTILGCD